MLNSMTFITAHHMHYDICLSFMTAGMRSVLRLFALATFAILWSHVAFTAPVVRHACRRQPWLWCMLTHRWLWTNYDDLIWHGACSSADVDTGTQYGFILLDWRL